MTPEDYEIVVWDWFKQAQEEDCDSFSIDFLHSDETITEYPRKEQKMIMDIATELGYKKTSWQMLQNPDRVRVYWRKIRIPSEMELLQEACYENSD